MITLRDVTKVYTMGGEEIFALNHVSVEIEKGEFVAIVGPSGSGKSTLANVIGGLDIPDSGDVVVSRRNITKIKDKELSAYRNEKIGFIFQSFNLQQSYTALENAALPLVFAKVSLKERREKATKALTAVGLEDRLKHKPNELSGGQRQRVSIARALTNDPEIVIADEPTGNLDSKTGETIISLLRSLNTQNDITLIVITHDPHVAKQADRVLEMRDGTLQ